MSEYGEYEKLQAQNKKLKEALDNLVEDILTPHRLGIANEPLNPNWVSLNKARQVLREVCDE